MCRGFDTRASGFLWHDDHRDVEWVRYIRHAAARAYRADRRCLRIHRIDRAREPVRDQVVQDLMTHRAFAPRRAYNGDRPRRKKRRELLGRSCVDAARPTMSFTWILNNTVRCGAKSS